MEFKSKAALGRYIKELLNKSEPGTILSGEDEVVIKELINKHPKASEKIGPGISYIVVRRDPVWKRSKQFVIIRGIRRGDGNL